MAYEDDIRKALAEVESCSKPNYTTIAEKYGLVWSTLSRRAKGETTSGEQFQSERHQCLTNV
jgi:hypothetical protein